MKNSVFPFALLLLTACVTPQLARANDSAFSGIPGTPTLLKGEHKQIRMESEKVIITAKPSTFDTSATFIFVNDSSQRLSVPMGFPELNYGDGWEEEDMKTKSSGFKKFATFVNGKPIIAKRTFVGSDAWWLKTVPFAPRERKVVRVETTSEYGGNVMWGFNHCVAYNFTGKNWKGNVSRSDLEIKIAEPALWSAVGESFANEKSSRWKPDVTIKNGVATIKKSWLNWQAQSTVYLGLWKTVPFWMVESPTSIYSMGPDVLPNVVTFRTGGEAGKIGAVQYNRPQGLVKAGIPFVQFSHLKNRLDSMANNINEKNPAKVSTTWSAQDQTATLNAGPVRIGFKVGSKTMSVTKNGKVQANVALPAAPFFVRDDSGGSDLFVPMLPALKTIGLSAKIENEKRYFTISRAGWLQN